MGPANAAFKNMNAITSITLKFESCDKHFLNHEGTGPVKFTFPIDPCCPENSEGCECTAKPGFYIEEPTKLILKCKHMCETCESEFSCTS